ncbi:LysR family transcriptional regulator [Xenorhabdus mauleonii]|uniref:LysR family transcriptional regulator n=1 Tax=Xenorhabdus mauleonii TaxID=351675 RepID=A0A1I3PH20_9GAMM|nr:LysR family transcriptional regulator [Xenorhabdus mauleonii]PHM44801.1 LysR family transcriptional regulator [Xenorhabdus mauleonii]SFJ20855.1 transcriptional regulator, LysR family [Xenorhabdus mauleonii]
MAYSDPFRYTAVFLHVVETGSFTLAAEKLSMSKSGVAKSISRLEAQLGVRLFNRTTRRLSLTDEGHAYSKRCSRALAELENAQLEISARKIAPSGKLRVDMPVVFGKRWVLPILMDIVDKYPELELVVSLTDRRINLIDDGVDLVIRIGQLNESATLVARPLGVQKSVVCASPQYLAKFGYPSEINELTKHQCITFGSDGHTLPWHFLDEQGNSQPIQVQGRITSNHSETILDAALHGHGIALLSDWLVSHYLQNGQLIRLLPEIQTQGFPIHAVWPQNKHLSPKVRVVVDALADSFISKKPWDKQNSAE